jgi:hypothetical protein
VGDDLIAREAGGHLDIADAGSAGDAPQDDRGGRARGHQRRYA